VRTKLGRKGAAHIKCGFGEWERPKRGRLGLRERTHVLSLERWVVRGLGECARVWDSAPQGGHVRDKGGG
jgi:hypothetical protein